MTISTLDDEQTVTGNGDLTYSMNVVAGVVGGNSVVTITPNNNISGIGAR